MNQQYIYMYLLCFRFPSRFRASQSTELHSMPSLVIYFTHSTNSAYMPIPISRFTTLPLPPGYTYVCSLRLCLCFCFVNKIYTVFFGFHIYALLYDICLSLSDLLHSVKLVLLGPLRGSPLLPVTFQVGTLGRQVGA